MQQKNTIEIDAEGRAVGRVASEVAKILQGKHVPTFIPHLDPQSYVVVKNVSKVTFSGRKLEQKDYRHHTMHPGGLKVRAMKHIFDEDPANVLRKAVNGMLPKNRRRTEFMKRLTIQS